MTNTKTKVDNKSNQEILPRIDRIIHDDRGQQVTPIGESKVCHSAGGFNVEALNPFALPSWRQEAQHCHAAPPSFDLRERESPSTQQTLHISSSLFFPVESSSLLDQASESPLSHGPISALDFLEMEEPTTPIPAFRLQQEEKEIPHFGPNPPHLQDSYMTSQSCSQINRYDEPIRTSSGLILTHRRPFAATHECYQPRRILTYYDDRYAPVHDDEDNDYKKKSNSFRSWFPPSTPSRCIGVGSGIRDGTPMEMDYLQVQHSFYGCDSDYFSRGITGKTRGHSSILQRLFRYVRLWMILSCLSLTLGTAVLFRHMRHELRPSTQQKLQQESINLQTKTADSTDNLQDHQHRVVTRFEQTSSSVLRYGNDQQDALEQDMEESIILLPLSNISRFVSENRGSQLMPPLAEEQQPPRRQQMRRVLLELRQEFEGWVSEHGKSYSSQAIKEQRFRIWAKNHRRTLKKNERHGPCQFTNAPVFGSNLFKDLTPEEFKSRYLTGYQSPRSTNGHRSLRVEEQQSLGSARTTDRTRRRRNQVLRPDDPSIRRHPSIQKRLLEIGVPLPSLQESSSTWSTIDCNWYDVSCWLRWLYNTYGLGFGSTMEPRYDSNTYPTTMDWREFGAVTSVHSQGSCGACWAITAVETIESAHFIATGNLYELSEAEIILCDTSCQMCNGGWPQNAYEYTMKNNGLPLEKSLPYNGEILLTMTMVKSGLNSDETDNSYFSSYLQNTCPNSNGGDGPEGGGGRQLNYFNYFNYNNNKERDETRYGQINGYGYATERCVCYTDGTGCNCDKQNEKMAVLNVASHGPATVCLEASLWQDYTGGIMTSEIGCSAKFLDMNHCVQVVGYAYMEVQKDGDGNGDHSRDDNKRDNNKSNGDAQRVGYWIVRNQWSNAWGMNGYAYVAMGENTCGILNDMTQAYYKK